MLKELTVSIVAVLALTIIGMIVVSERNDNPDIDRIFAAMRRADLLTGYFDGGRRRCDAAPSVDLSVEICARKDAAAARLEHTLAMGKIAPEPELVVAAGYMILRMTYWGNGEPDRARMDEIASVFIANAPN